MGLKILIYGCDTGGANALGEVIESLLTNYSPHRVELEIFSKGLGYKIWKKRGFPAKKFPEKSRMEEIVKRSDVVFTATSFPPEVETMLWKTAKSLGKPSVVLLDFWTHYAERFTDPNNGNLLWPDKIAVIDETAQRALIDCKVPDERIEITGQPFLERRIKDFSNIPVSTDKELKGLNIMFISQPLHKLPGAKKWGYDEFKALDCIVEALNSLAELDGLNPDLIIRPHPRENSMGLKAHLKGLDLKFKWSFDKEADPDKTIARCRFIFGMSSMLLIEAALADKNVASIQPGLVSEDPFPLSRLGYCKRITGPERLREYIVEGMAEKKKKRTKVLNEFTRINLNSCERIIKLLLSYEKMASLALS